MKISLGIIKLVFFSSMFKYRITSTVIIPPIYRRSSTRTTMRTHRVSTSTPCTAGWASRSSSCSPRSSCSASWRSCSRACRTSGARSSCPIIGSLVREPPLPAIFRECQKSTNNFRHAHVLRGGFSDLHGHHRARRVAHQVCNA